MESEAEARARQDAEAVAVMRARGVSGAHDPQARAAAVWRARDAAEKRARVAAEKRDARQKEKLAKALLAAERHEFKAQLARERKDTLERFMLDRSLERDLSSYSERDPDGLDMARERERQLSARDKIRSEWERLTSKRSDSERER